MLLGEYPHRLDEKGRLPIPSKLRTKLGNIVIVARSFENQLSVYRVDAFKRLLDKLRKLPPEVPENRHLLLLISASAEEVVVDRQGRIRLSLKLRELASLETEVIVLGVVDHLEIWDPESWRDFKAKKEGIVDVAERIARLS